MVKRRVVRGVVRVRGRVRMKDMVAEVLFLFQLSRGRKGRRDQIKTIIRSWLIL